MFSAPVLAVLLLLHVAGGGECRPREEVLDYLAARYGEMPVMRGLDTSGAVVEIVAARDGATWTLLSSRADGTTCIIGAGMDLQVAQPKARGAPA